MKKIYKTSKQAITCFAVLLLSLLALQRASAQSLRLSGTVKDETGSPLPGVTVAVQGTTSGTVTDTKGRFQINANINNVLQFSFVGYNTALDTVRNTNAISINLQPSAKTLSDVVVVGYGTQSKNKVSGAITTVKSKDVALSPSPNLGAGLAGRVPGVVINNRGGEPGNEGVEVYIRGRSTNGDASPLYVIDGIVRDYGGLNFVPPADVESITVLKDASAAIYGSRAANGVILITTKRGKTGRAEVSATYNQAFSQPERIPETAGSPLFAEMANLQRQRQGCHLFIPTTILNCLKTAAIP
ncbi:MAG: TonB-dependent receptor plug domain-containing protein [Mucilaginibacter sp.]|nr:TonB-dependent receptor plug domain-containing protein [Mucilaginibacter sp.]